MTDLIPRDAAIDAVYLAVWKSPIKAKISTIDASIDTIEALRAIPAIDPAAIREAALKEAAELCAENEAGLQFRGKSGWNISPRSECAGSHSGDAYSAAILALIGEKK